MTTDNIDPEGFYRDPDPLCVCGPLYTYAGHIEPGGYAEGCPIHGNPKVFYDEAERLRAGIKALTRTGYDHTPDCVKEQEQARHAGEEFWHPDCGRCWEGSLLALLNPTEGEK